MLYTNHHTSIQKLKKRGCDSSWNTTSVFSGDYWDEFGLLVAQDSPKQTKILVLGAGKGACIRPILLRNGLSKITLVDTDFNSLKETKKVFQKHFKNIQNLDFISEKAEVFLEKNTVKFDLIWVDLYSDEGYAPCMENPSFYQYLYQSLNPNGAIGVNCFTIPTPLSLERSSDCESYIVNKLAKHTDKIHCFPYRRNVTIIARKEDLCSMPKEPQFLKPKDKIISSIQRLRIIRNISKIANEPPSKLLSFSEIDREFKQKWDCYPSKKTKEIHHLLSSKSLDVSDFDRFCSFHKDAKSFLSVYVGALDKKNVDKIFLKWSIKEMKKIDRMTTIDIHFFLTQLAAVVARQKIQTDSVENIESQLIKAEVL